jgi:hypothetical protein
MSGGVNKHSALGRVLSDYIELSTIATKYYYRLREETIETMTKRGHLGMTKRVSKEESNR